MKIGKLFKIIRQHIDNTTFDKTARKEFENKQIPQPVDNKIEAEFGIFEDLEKAANVLKTSMLSGLPVNTLIKKGL